jgi:hypothetical protein
MILLLRIKYRIYYYPHLPLIKKIACQTLIGGMVWKMQRIILPGISLFSMVKSIHNQDVPAKNIPAF